MKFCMMCSTKHALYTVYRIGRHFVGVVSVCHADRRSLAEKILSASSHTLLKFSTMSFDCR